MPTLSFPARFLTRVYKRIALVTVSLSPLVTVRLWVNRMLAFHVLPFRRLEWALGSVTGCYLAASVLAGVAGVAGLTMIVTLASSAFG